MRKESVDVSQSHVPALDILWARALILDVGRPDTSSLLSCTSADVITLVP